MSRLLATIILVVVIVVVLGPPLILLNGWAVQTLWGWFVVPVFKVPALSLLQAAGLAVVIGYMTTEVDTKKSEDKSGAAIIVSVFLRAPLAVLTGWVITWFM
jgi:hypothetical protein